MYKQWMIIKGAIGSAKLAAFHTKDVWSKNTSQFTSNNFSCVRICSTYIGCINHNFKSLTFTPNFAMNVTRLSVLWSNCGINPAKICNVTVKVNRDSGNREPGYPTAISWGSLFGSLFLNFNLGEPTISLLQVVVVKDYFVLHMPNTQGMQPQTELAKRVPWLWVSGVAQ